ncbi:MAG TPA: tetratricopeptide repeat protein [Anaeromyxobacteraceae bacterium]|nr:tetratricopeptide repeat protein [Anaeromyxobacteraceae bacterium]
MATSDTFEEMARRLARGGAAWGCAAEADRLASRAALAGGEETGGAGTGARGLRIAARILEALAPEAPERAPFRPLGLRGAVLAGHLALAEGRPGQAELVGRGVAAAAPDSPAGLRLTGQALFARGKFEEAAAALREALAVDPADGVTRALHAEALWFSGRREQAEDEFVRLVAGEGEGARLAEALWYAARCGALEDATAEAQP